MDEHLSGVLNESKKTISKLQLLSAFFGDDTVYKIYLRTQVIHNLFERNSELDASKLELFHLQFTSSVIDLLKQIKKNNEKNVSLIYDEIQLNNELIDKLNSGVYTEKTYKLDKHRQALKISTSLRQIFQVLSNHTSEFPFAKNIHSFSSRYGKDFYFDISNEQLSKLTAYEKKDVYSHEHAVIERKLLGQLCKYDFKVDFFCGLRSGPVVLEVYKLAPTDKYFIFVPSRSLFLFCDLAEIEGIDKDNDLSKRANIIHELLHNNDRLESTAAARKTSIPTEVCALLDESYDKISDINFLDNITGVDVQANILKAMLKTDMM